MEILPVFRRQQAVKHLRQRFTLIEGHLLRLRDKSLSQRQLFHRHDHIASRLRIGVGRRCHAAHCGHCQQQREEQCAYSFLHTPYSANNANGQQSSTRGQKHRQLIHHVVCCALLLVLAHRDHAACPRTISAALSGRCIARGRCVGFGRGRLCFSPSLRRPRVGRHSARITLRGQRICKQIAVLAAGDGLTVQRTIDTHISIAGYHPTFPRSACSAHPSRYS